MDDFKFIEIDTNNWERQEIYDVFRNISYTVTSDIDVTRYMELYKGKVKFYPFMNYIASTVANNNECFRMARVNDKVGYFDRVDPIYTVLRENNLFSHGITRYSEDFVDFYHRFLVDKAHAEKCTRLYDTPDFERPINAMSISTLPHMSFKEVAFLYDLGEVTEYIPFSTFGKIYLRDGRYYTPIATRFCHEVNDGYHANLYYEKIQELVDSVIIDVDKL